MVYQLHLVGEIFLRIGLKIKYFIFLKLKLLYVGLEINYQFHNYLRWDCEIHLKKNQIVESSRCYANRAKNLSDYLGNNHQPTPSGLHVAINYKEIRDLPRFRGRGLPSQPTRNQKDKLTLQCLKTLKPKEPLTSDLSFSPHVSPTHKQKRATKRVYWNLHAQAPSHRPSSRASSHRSRRLLNR